SRTAFVVQLPDLRSLKVVNERPAELPIATSASDSQQRRPTSSLASHRCRAKSSPQSIPTARNHFRAKQWERKGRIQFLRSTKRRCLKPLSYAIVLARLEGGEHNATVTVFYRRCPGPRQFGPSCA